MSRRRRAKEPDAVRAHYEGAWRAYLGAAESIAREEGGNLSRLLHRCLRSQTPFGHKPKHRYRPEIGGQPLSLGVPIASHTSYYLSVLVETIRELLPPQTRRIVELGSGWGMVIASLWLAGAPRHAEYFALEYTESGRKLARLLAEGEPGFKLQSCAFDYHDADFSMLKGAEPTVLFSTFSIEQITDLPDDCIERMLAIPGFTRAIHIEPVGWQLQTARLGAGLERILRRYGLPPLGRAGSVARRCWRHRKNRNLIALLRRFERQGRIVIEKIEPDLVATNPRNPGTLVVWRKL